MLTAAQLIRPGEERWDSARAAWNLAIDQRPAVVAQPHDADGFAAEVITADGKLVRADRSNEPDLFWALCGGGGSFGAVTALEFELYPAEELYAGMFAWPWERTADVLHAWREWISGLPDELSTLA